MTIKKLKSLPVKQTDFWNLSERCSSSECVCVLLMSNIVCVASLLLQISVNFKAVVSRVGHGHVSV